MGRETEKPAMVRGQVHRMAGKRDWLGSRTGPSASAFFRLTPKDNAQHQAGGSHDQVRSFAPQQETARGKESKTAERVRQDRPPVHGVLAAQVQIRSLNVAYHPGNAPR